MNHICCKTGKNFNPAGALKQTGFSSLLFVVLVGLSLTVLTVGYMSSMRNLQSTAVTAHAQTQAQMQAMIGYQGLTEFLKGQSIENINKIETGTLTRNAMTIPFSKVSCGTGQYCFDITGKSGGASAILRSNFLISERLDKKTQTGSIFAGGLTVGGNSSLTGNGVSIAVKDGIVKNNSGTDISGQLTGITVEKYTASNFIKAEDLKDQANYTFSLDSSGNQVCEKANLYAAGGGVIAKQTFNCSQYNGITYSGGAWSIDSSKTLPAGVLWFKEKVVVNLTTTDLINTVISVGGIESKIPSGNKGVGYNAYAPNAYFIKIPLAVISKICGTSGAIPVQYCKSDGTLKPLEELDDSPANIGNILFLTNGQLALDSGNLGGKGSGVPNAVNYYGNLIASSGAGGTGLASAKFVGTGLINIFGNIVITGETDATELNGNIKVDLINADATGSSMPVLVKDFLAKGIRYM